jgi:hypothetical protein
MDTIFTWARQAIYHPITTIFGTLPTVWICLEWVFGNPHASRFEMVQALVSIVIGAAMNDPKKKP